MFVINQDYLYHKLSHFDLFFIIKTTVKTTLLLLLINSMKLVLSLGAVVSDVSTIKKLPIFSLAHCIDYKFVKYSNDYLESLQ